MIGAVLPSLAASAVFLGAGGVDGVECVTLSGPSVVNDRLRLTDNRSVLTLSGFVKLFLQLFRARGKKSAKTREKVVDRYTYV